MAKNSSRATVTNSPLHAAAVERYKLNHGPVNRRENAATQAAARASRTPQQQLDVLNARLGRNVGAANERARLKRLIAA
jgi:hypothetical protein